jgi:hypothetical protein
MDGAQESSKFHTEMLAERTEVVMVAVTCDSDLYLTQVVISCEKFNLKVYGILYRNRFYTCQTVHSKPN